MKLLIPVASGLEQITKRQLFSLGYEKAPADNGRIEVEGDWQDIARLNLFLRSGERVLILLARFHAETFDELFDGIYALPWEEWLTADSKILMDGKSVQSKLAAIKAAGGVQLGECREQLPRAALLRVFHEERAERLSHEGYAGERFGVFACARRRSFAAIG
jgi:putative N6-adenine-specific DNA methylase